MNDFLTKLNSWDFEGRADTEDEDNEENDEEINFVIEVKNEVVKAAKLSRPKVREDRQS